MRCQPHVPFSANPASKPATNLYCSPRCSGQQSTATYRPFAFQSKASKTSTDQLEVVRSSATAACISAVAACLLFGSTVSPAQAARGKVPPITEFATRCEVSALDKFADTRAKFSQEASGGNMVEAIVDIRGCDFSNQDLSGKVFSGVMMQGTNLSNSQVVGSQFARADASGAKLQNVDFTDANCYGSKFDGADVTGAQFENSILTGATFGRDREGNWADLKGAHFEGALLSSSDIGRICENPTLEITTKKYELGCRVKK